MRDGRPLVVAVNGFDETFGQQTFEVAEEDDIVLAVKVEPTGIAQMGIVALSMDGFLSVKDVIKRLPVDVAECHVEILAQRHIAVAVNDKAAHDALATKVQMPISPLVVKGYVVVVLLCVVDVLGYLLEKVGGRQQGTGRVEECHGAVDANTYVDVVLFCHVDDILHVLKRIPWRQTEHQ